MKIRLNKIQARTPFRLGIIAFSILFHFSIMLATLNTATAIVWITEHEWNEEYELKYSNWVQNTIDKKYFYRKGSLLYKFPTDCADMLYAFRIEFAYKQKLPFVMQAPGSIKSLLTNKTNKFNSIINEQKRVRAFIEYISREAGTLNLRNDTFPVDIYQLRPGDIYATKWYFLGESARHSSIVKKINEKKGYISFLASNAPRKVRKLIFSPKKPDFTFRKSPWGYARWKWPSDYNYSNQEIPFQRGYSEMQYDLLKRYGEFKVHRKIKEIIKNRNK